MKFLVTPLNCWRVFPLKPLQIEMLISLMKRVGLLYRIVTKPRCVGMATDYFFFFFSLTKQTLDATQRCKRGIVQLVEEEPKFSSKKLIKKEKKVGLILLCGWNRRKVFLAKTRLKPRLSISINGWFDHFHLLEFIVWMILVKKYPNGWPMNTNLVLMLFITDEVWFSWWKQG